MSTPAENLRPPATNRGLLIPGLWWQPSRIAFHRNGHWQTFSYPNYTPIVATAKAVKSVAVSPIGTDGLAWFAAWDVDSGNPQDVAAVLRALPAGATPLVSASGKKGWHVWCFFDRPLPVQTAVSFAKAVRAKAGVLCEIRPTRANSLCLKWPGQKHPETGKVEEFINLDTGEAYDTEALLAALAGGMWRTDAAVIADYAKHGKAKDTTWFARANHVDATWTPKCLQGGTKLVRSLDELATQEELARELMRLAGRKPGPLGKAFRCILPEHEERHPSGSFFRAKDGHILYGDFHARDGEATYTLGEVYHALATGRVTKLKPHDKARWLAMLGLRCGFATELVLRQREKLEAAAAILAQLQQGKQAAITQHDSSSTIAASSYPTRGYYSSGWLQRRRGPLSRGANAGEVGDWAIVNRVWEAVCEEVEIQAFAGFEEVALSKRFLARRAGVRPELANRAVNLLCCLGLLEKVPGSGGMRGDRLTLADAGFEEARQRLLSLFPNGEVNLRRFNKVLVAAKLGEDVAAAVFRRRAETLVAYFNRSCNQSRTNEALVENLNQSCNQLGTVWPTEGPLKVLRRYSEGTAKVLRRYPKGIADVSEDLSEGTPKVLRRYWQATGQSKGGMVVGEGGGHVNLVGRL